MRYEIPNIQTYPLKEEMKARGVSFRILREKTGIGEGHLCRLANNFYVAQEETAQKVIRAVESFPLKATEARKNKDV